MPQQLNAKEASLFRQVVKHYELKQYKKGLKAADQVLRKVPNHGETQAMRALILQGQGHAEEAFALAKEALRNDMKSHVCWHVYGLLYRYEKNYEEAAKAYKYALRIEPESQPILRDLALLQVQMRDFEGYIQTRNVMLQQRPALRLNWTALAVAYHLGGHLAEAERVLTTYEETLKSTPPKTDMEHSEAMLYKNSIIAESGDLERALTHLDSIGKRCLDRLAVVETRADYLLRLGRKEEAANTYRALLERNAENRAYYNGLIAALGLESSDHKALKDIYDEYLRKNPKGDAARRIPLDFLEGDEFRDAADKYLRRMLQKRIPSLFANVKALYANEEKKKVVQELVEGYLVTGNSDGSNSGDADDKKAAFETYTLYFLAQHYNYHLSRDLSRAMELIDKAIEKSPDSVEFYMTKARVWKHLGNSAKAAEVMDKARTLDQSDRYINSKTARYQLRNDQNELALQTASKFTRNEAVGGPLGDLQDMQVVWYLTEDGESYLRQKKIGLALKRFTQVLTIFETWQEDQFDFHSFSLRKGQIRAYIDMVRWEDHLRDHPFFTRAAVSAIKAYLLLFDHPDFKNILLNGINGGKNLDDLDEAARKKAIKKAKREQQRREKAEADKREAKKASAATASGEDTRKPDLDPMGRQLIATKDPLGDAMKFLQPLLDHSSSDVVTQNLGFEVFTRKNKPFLALKCLLAAHSIDASDPILHMQTVRFRQSLDQCTAGLPPKAAELLRLEFFTILPENAKLEDFNSEFLEKHSKSAAHVQSGAMTRQLINPDSKASNEKTLLDAVSLESISLSEACDGLEILRSWGADTKDYVENAHKRWPEATVF